MDHQEAWRQGCEEFNLGRYWHAHEAWERGWTRLPAPEKDYLQALIQAAAVAHLLTKGRVRPACALAARALEKLGRARPADPREGAFRVVIPGVEEVLAQAQRGEGDLEAFSRLRARLDRTRASRLD